MRADGEDEGDSGVKCRGDGGRQEQVRDAWRVEGRKEEGGELRQEERVGERQEGRVGWGETGGRQAGTGCQRSVYPARCCHAP